MLFRHNRQAPFHRDSLMLLSSFSLLSSVRLALILVIDLCFPFFFITCTIVLPSPPIVSTPLYPSPSFSIPLPLNLSSCSLPISVSVFLFSFYPPLQAHPVSSSIVPLPFVRHIHPHQPPCETLFHTNFLPQLLHSLFILFHFIYLFHFISFNFIEYFFLTKSYPFQNIHLNSNQCVAFIREL